MKKILFAAVAAASAGMLGAAEPNAADFPLSPWDKAQKELKKSSALPIRYASAFEREREMLGYNPRFMPGMLTFMPGSNRPVMRVGLMDESKLGLNKHTAPTRIPGKINLIQFLGDDGRWHTTDGHVKAVRKAMGNVDELLVFFGERTTDAVEFDPNGGAYTIVLASGTKNGSSVMRRYLVYSPDAFQTFQAIQVPYNDARLEPWRPNADQKEPWLVTRDGKGNHFIVPLKAENGKVAMGEAVKIIDAKWKPLCSLMPMSGDGSMMITRDGKSFVPFMAQIGVENDPGSPHYIVMYDHASGTVTEPVFLGTTGTRVDGHNVPVIDVDSKGTLHVVCGSHWHSFMHYRSSAPLSIEKWEKPLAIGAGPDNRWSRDGLSYPAFAIDANDNWNLVARGRNVVIQKIDKGGPYDMKNQDTYINYALVHFTKSGNGWGPRKDVVIPGYNPYSNWYQKCSLDRKGNYYLLYYYIALHMHRFPNVYAEYQKKWPEEGNDPRM
ncbi:MAG: BNR-4 repeat-containing protein [Lentisphaeria bacterium]|nr:BNR-4 repeat-containing protein [Lentisphaeria bacterium]